MRTGMLATAGLMVLANPAIAYECRLALVLALDVSASMSPDDDRLQREGLALALMDPQIAQAFLSGAPVALYVFQWSGVSAQSALLPGWVVIRSEEDLANVAAAISTSQKTNANHLDGLTAVGTALAFAAGALEEGPDCWAKTIDVSSDGVSNGGIDPEAIYMALSFTRVTVNALVVTSTKPKIDPWQNEDLVAWFEAEVLHGPGAFLIEATGYEDYEQAMKAKLQRELQAPLLSGWSAGGEAG